MTVNERELAHIPLAKVQIRSESNARSGSTATQIEVVVIIGVHPVDFPDYHGRLEMTPVSVEPHVRRQVGQREPCPNPLQLDAIRSLALVSTSAGSLSCNGYGVLSFQRHPTKLHIAEPCDAIWTPVLVRVREHIGIHEGAPVLAGAEVFQLAPCVPQTESGLSRISTSAE